MSVFLRYSAVAGVALAMTMPSGGQAQTVLTAASSVDGVISVPDTAGKPITINGDGKTPVSFWFPYDWAPKIAIVTESGSITDVHATGQTTSLTNVPTAFFSDGQELDLTGKVPVVLTPVPTSTNGTILHAPAVLSRARPGDIVGARLENNTAQALPSRVVTFGQAFVQGDLPAGSALVATTAAGATVPVQMDVKARHADGSVRHAVLTVMAPPIAAASALDIMLSRSASGAPGAALTAQGLLAQGYDVQLVLSGASINATVNAATVLSSAQASGAVQTWLSGPYAAEYRVTAPIDGHLRATFDIRAMADGGVLTDVTVANDYSYVAPQTYGYGAKITDHGATVWSASGITQGRFQEWHKAVLSRPAGAHPVLDVAYLEQAGALPTIDLSTGVGSNIINGQLGLLTAANTAPMGAALVTQYMGETGGRDDIGMTTNWEANYLAVQNAASETVMLANADAAASIPWHVRETNGLPITADTHPGLWNDSRCSGSDCATGGFNVSATGWSLDFSHEPDLSYVPYLVTGGHYYLDQLQAEANAAILALNPGYRGPSDLLYVSNQIRGVAWNLRDLSNAAWITPDTDPTKGYFVTKTMNNLAGLYQLYVAQRSMRAYGAIEGFILADHPTTTAPWEQDFVAMAFGQAAARGFAQAPDLSSWMVNFVSGRFIHGADGYNPLHGPAYWPYTVDPVSGKDINTWAWFYQANFAGQPAPTVLDGYPDAPDGYAAIGRAGNAALFSATHSPDALQAFAFIVSQSPAIYGGFQTGNAFNINPQLPDGHVLQNGEIAYAPAAGGTITAPTGHSLLIGSAGPTTLRGAPGVSILYAGSGATTLVAASGTNFVYPGAGRGTVTGAPGTTYVKNGTGAVQINLNAADSAVDTIDGFKPGIDHIHVTGLAGSSASIAASAVATTAGGLGAASLKVGAAHTVVVRGMTPAQLQSAFD